MLNCFTIFKTIYSSEKFLLTNIRIQIKCLNPFSISLISRLRRFHQLGQVSGLLNHIYGWMIFPAAASQNIVTCICRGHPVCDWKIIVCFLLVNLFAGESRKLRIQARGRSAIECFGWPISFSSAEEILLLFNSHRLYYIAVYSFFKFH